MLTKYVIDETWYNKTMNLRKEFFRKNILRSLPKRRCIRLRVIVNAAAMGMDIHTLTRKVNSNPLLRREYTSRYVSNYIYNSADSAPAYLFVKALAIAVELPSADAAAELFYPPGYVFPSGAVIPIHPSGRQYHFGEYGNLIQTGGFKLEEDDDRFESGELVNDVFVEPNLLATFSDTARRMYEIEQYNDDDKIVIISNCKEKEKEDRVTMTLNLLRSMETAGVKSRIVRK